jgi:hypothetical protein
MIPGREVWLLGAPDVGHWRLRLRGEETDGATLLAVDALPTATAAVPAAGPAHLPEPLVVGLVPRPATSHRVDAVLVDDGQLDWLRAYLSARPAGEVAFLLPGPGWHLLTAPGGLAGEVPFGIPLARIGPGGLYLELGVAFDPPLPEGARRQAFQAEAGTVVAVTQQGCYRFDRDRMVPAWSLWLGKPPEVRGGLSAAGAQLLAGISDAIRRLEAQRTSAQPASPTRVAPGDRPRLLEEAAAAELDGNLELAARLLESAGELARAGRLYEQAAGALLKTGRG